MLYFHDSRGEDDGEKENVEQLFCVLLALFAPFSAGCLVSRVGGKVYVPFLFPLSGCAGCHFATLLSTPPDTHIHKNLLQFTMMIFMFLSCAPSPFAFY